MKKKTIDYSCDLPALINRLEFLSSAIWDRIGETRCEPLSPSYVRGAAGLLDDAIRELREMNEGLYGEKAA